jgi:hypothetical protein
LLLQRVDPALGFLADEIGNFRLDVLRRDLVADVVSGVGDLLPQLIDGRRQLRAVGSDSRRNSSTERAIASTFRVLQDELTLS